LAARDDECRIVAALRAAKGIHARDEEFIHADGKITAVNEATVQATGVARDALVGKDLSELFTGPEKARAGYQQVFATGQVTDYPLTLRHVSGRLTEVLLLVKDSAADAELTMDALRSAHLVDQVQWVKDGAEALDVLFGRDTASAAASQRPKHVLLDLRLPRVDGLEVLRAVAELGRYWTILNKLPGEAI